MICYNVGFPRKKRRNVVEKIQKENNDVNASHVSDEAPEIMFASLEKIRNEFSDIDKVAGVKYYLVFLLRFRMGKRPPEVL